MGRLVFDPATPVAVLRSGQEQAAAAAIAAGHADYPAFRHVFADPRRRAKALPAFFRTTVRDAILERADRDGLPCRLETSDAANIDFYQRFGFEVCDPAFAAIPGGPFLTTMRRLPPRTPRATTRGARDVQ